MDERDLRRAVRGLMLEALSPEGVKLLLKIDNGPYHMMPADEFDHADLPLLADLIKRKLVKHLQGNRRFPERFVLTDAGTHETGTFEWDTLSSERRSRQMTKRRAERNVASDGDVTVKGLDMKSIKV